MNQILISKITERGQVTIPQKIRKSPAFSNARAVLFAEKDGAVTIRPLSHSDKKTEYLSLLDTALGDWTKSEHDDLFDFS